MRMMKKWRVVGMIWMRMKKIWTGHMMTLRRSSSGQI
jgi:hypothetical protein